MALNDRLKLRSMVCAEKGEAVYFASEECAIRVMEPDVKRFGRPGRPGRCCAPERRRDSVGKGRMGNVRGFIYPEYEVVRNYQRCIACRACERQCANEVHRYDADEQMMTRTTRNASTATGA